MVATLINPFNMIRDLLREKMDQKIQELKNQMIPHVLVFIPASVLLILISVCFTGIWQFIQYIVYQLITSMLTVVIILLILFKSEVYQHFFPDADFVMVDVEEVEIDSDFVVVEEEHKFILIE